YLADTGVSTVAYLALAMQRPVLLEGEPGTGKTALAEAMADAFDVPLIRLQCYEGIDAAQAPYAGEFTRPIPNLPTQEAAGAAAAGTTALAEAMADAFDVPLIRLQCYEGIDAAQALYDWDFTRQILHLRTLEAAGAAHDLQATEESLFDERFLLARPILRALRESPAVVLVDEIDRADDEFEAFLLEVLSTYQVSIPDLGTSTAAEPPGVLPISNRTRDLHDALKRRCL